MPTFEWSKLVEYLCAFPPHTQELRPPCPQERITEEERRLGQMPSGLVEMLHLFNGGKLFVKTSPIITIFGLTLDSDSTSLDWFIDRFTPRWRATLGQTSDWVIGMTNYGGIVVLDSDQQVSEWDTSQRDWLYERYSLTSWIEKLMEDGTAYLKEV